MIGQINLDSKLGKIIYEFVLRDDINTVVEIGTWNGWGSTECIRKAIIESNKSDYSVYSLEINSEMYKQAISREFPKNFNILLGKIIEESDLNWMNWDQYFNSPEGWYHAGNKREWLIEDINNLRKVNNVIETIPSYFDLLILDGGEFTTYPEYLKIGERSKFIILDDTNELKCRKVRSEILNDKKYSVIIDDLYERNGILVAEKIQ